MWRSLTPFCSTVASLLLVGELPSAYMYSWRDYFGFVTQKLQNSMEKTKSKIVGLSNSIARKNNKNDPQFRKESYSLTDSNDYLKCIPLSSEVEKIQTLNEKKRYDNSDYKDDCRVEVTTKLASTISSLIERSNDHYS